MSGLGSFLAGIAATVTKRALVGIGVGVVSYAALGTAVNAALSAAKSAWGGMAGDALALVQLAGVGQAISIIAGGMLAAVAVTALKSFEVK